jgi:hypothetical protein
MIQRFTTRPKAVEAIRFTGTDACIRELAQWAGDVVGNAVCDPETGRVVEIEIYRVVDSFFRSVSPASVGDWIVRYQGHYLVINDHDFTETYQPVYEKNR